MLRSEIPSGMCAKLRTVAASNNRNHPIRSFYYCLFAPHIYCCSSGTSRSWWSTHSTQRHRRGGNNIPSFLQRTAPIARSLCEGWTRHDLHILVTAPFCCDRIARAACAQTLAMWQQATIEITRRDHSICLFAPHIYIVVLRAHSVRGESHIQRNANGEVATVTLILENHNVFVNNLFIHALKTDAAFRVLPRLPDIYHKLAGCFATIC